MSVKNEGFLHLEFSMISSLNDSYRTIISVYGCDPINYEDLFVKDSLIEIKHFNLNKKIQMELNNTNIYISEVLNNEYGIKFNEKILYKIDDLIIYGDNEYLDPKNLKKYPIGEDIFWISLNCTLADIEKFNSLYFNISSSK